MPTLFVENVTRDEITDYINRLNSDDSGDYAADCERGSRLADKLIARVAETEDVPMFNWICRGVVETGTWRTAHIGFFSRLANYIVVTFDQ